MENKTRLLRKNTDANGYSIFDLEARYVTDVWNADDFIVEKFEYDSKNEILRVLSEAEAIYVLFEDKY